MEEWKILKENSNYKISNLGNVVSLVNKSSGTFTTIEYKIKQQIGRTGYLRVCLYKNRKGKKYSIHRLLGIYFIPNPLNKPIINHKDGNKLNNSLENLEWCTYKENAEHAYSIGLNKSPIFIKGKKNPSSILVINTETKDILTKAEAYKLSGYSYTHFSKMTKGTCRNNTKFILYSQNIQQ